MLAHDEVQLVSLEGGDRMPPDLPTEGQREGGPKGEDPRHAVDAAGSIQADPTPSSTPHPGAEACELSSNPELHLGRMARGHGSRWALFDHEGTLAEVVREVQSTEMPSPTEVQHGATACLSSKQEQPVDVDREVKCGHPSLHEEDATQAFSPQ